MARVAVPSRRGASDLETIIQKAHDTADANNAQQERANRKADRMQLARWMLEANRILEIIPDLIQEAINNGRQSVSLYAIGSQRTVDNLSGVAGLLVQELTRRRMYDRLWIDISGNWTSNNRLMLDIKRIPSRRHGR